MDNTPEVVKGLTNNESKVCLWLNASIYMKLFTQDKTLILKDNEAK